MREPSSNRTHYRAIKFVHLLGLATWLGPSTAGYVLLMIARLRGGTNEALALLPVYITLVDVEAAGLAVMVLSGLALRRLRPAYREALWLKMKLLIVKFVFIPLEAANLYICNFVLRGALDGRVAVLRAFHIYDRFSLVSMGLLGVFLPAVLYLAVFKPWTRKGSNPL